MKLKLLIFVALFGALNFISCKKADSLNVDNIYGLGGDTWPKTAIDDYIYNNYVKPYNIAVKYKWDKSEEDILANLTPPKEDLVIPILEAVKQGWVVPYVQVLGSDFFKKYSPKFLLLVGSYQYNSTGSMILGNAEGGAKVRFFGVNYFKIKGMDGYDPNTDATFIKLYIFHMVHHEFTHILNQQKIYQENFKTITKSLYQFSNWINYSGGNSGALKDGFITAYASSDYGEDFAEMTSTMLTEGQAGFDAIVNSIPAGTSINGTTQAQAQSRLRQKEALVVQYFKDSWGVDFYTLQSKSYAAIQALLY